MGAEGSGRQRGEISRLKEALVQRDLEIKQLKVANLFLETLFDGIAEEIFVIDPNYELRDVNRFFLERHRLEKGAVLGKKCYDVIYHEIGGCRAIQGDCPLKMALKTGGRVEVIHRHKGPDGEMKESIRIMYPLIPEGLEPQFFVEIARDVTDLRMLINKVRDSEKQFRAILDTATDAIVSLDEDQRIILFNNAAERIFRYSRQEIMGRNFNLLVPPQYGDHYRLVRAFLEGQELEGMGKTFAVTGLRKGGDAFPIEIGLSFTEVEGKTTFTAIMRDVTVQRQLEKTLLRSERLAAVGQAVARVAHEVKNPLMIIGGFSNQIRRGLTDQKTIQKLDLVAEEVRRLEKLVVELGDFTREYKLLKRRTDINAVIRDVLNIIGEIGPAGDYLFREELTPDLGEVVCDPDKMRQVFLNLITNGMEAMEEGGTVTISTEKLPQAVQIGIRDEGIGIREEDLMRIFEPFWTTRERGSGLGLAISFKIVQAHEGEIWAESRPGKGTVFFVRLPVG